MDREYIQYLKQEATASATRAISRAIAVSIYGVVGVYLLSTIMSGVLPKVAAILPLGSNAMGSQDEGGMDLYRADIWAFDDGDVMAIVFWCHDGEKTKYSNSAAR